MNKTTAHQLEQLMAQRLRELPLRRAPAALQSRVWHELERRAQLPWWHMSFLHWPLAARAALVVLCLGMANATVTMFNRLNPIPHSTQLNRLLNESFGWAESFASAMQALQSLIGLLLRHAPLPWLYGGLMALAALYATLLLVSTVAYRTLNVNR